MHDAAAAGACRAIKISAHCTLVPEDGFGSHVSGLDGTVASTRTQARYKACYYDFLDGYIERAQASPRVNRAHTQQKSRPQQCVPYMYMYDKRDYVAPQRRA